MTTVKNAINLDSPGVLRQLSKRIKDDIDAHCVAIYDDGHRSHLGASIIGQECDRSSWYTFRWVSHKIHSGRMYRIFNRGHREEERFIGWLRGIGFQVWDVAENGYQHTIKGALGHFGGSLDSAAKFPDAYWINEPLLCEFKTSGTGKKFADLLEKGVKLAKPQHFGQMSVYGFKYQLKYGLYMCVNKNDDDMHVEVVKLDWNLGRMLEVKACEIIASQEPPSRIAENRTYFTCKWCDFLDVCHNGAPAEKNCRSCKQASPVENAKWFCSTWNNVIPKEFIKQGCDEWKGIV